MGESRSELLAWLNDLLQINYTKIEQCGTGAAYCQIIDSIYGDVPMNRVKFNAKHEYEFIANLKILQNVFKAKKIDKPIPIERLVKCKMQDNLEFMQWMKRFWDANYPGQGYDPVARRKGAPTDTPATLAPLAPTARAPSSAGVRGKTPVTGRRPGSTQPNEAVLNLQAQVKEMSAHMEGLEKERDFYFNKLRDIEILVQAQLEVLEAEGQSDETLKKIQEILYSTEEGFEVPEGGAVDEEEMF
ncbi:calponin [Gloeophyllum trabeum ATCC 11539]|uniref:Calponin n=1 Tax=Gloeophyllum trabeum (strain ATCC 11539 / FP-39264 / Madison 617) TaxID=670483 RepID=S7RKK2_GLOTA|nr:calponin [Gloeophyllum trabeum ATCC 11539]EPQ54910.1 calponin [Gloeophyllum trabeum ATCC 11539]